MSASADLHDVWQSGHPLGIACMHCLHRALVRHESIGARQGNLTLVSQLPLRCSKCGLKDFEAHIFREQRLVRRFMAEYR